MLGFQNELAQWLFLVLLEEKTVLIFENQRKLFSIVVEPQIAINKRLRLIDAPFIFENLWIIFVIASLDDHFKSSKYIKCFSFG